MNKFLSLGFLIGLTYQTYSKPVTLEVQQPFNNSCHLCEEIIDVVEKDVNVFNRTITDIIVVIRDICQDVPGPSGKECIYILDNMQQIMRWVTGGMNSSTICHKIGFCNTTLLPLPCVDEL